MKTCPVCQAQNQDEARFCAKCGNSFTGQPAQPIIQVVQAPPPKKSKWGWVVGGGCLLLVLIVCAVIGIAYICR